MKHLKPENISIVFTGYNILEYIQLAVYSFLDMYPQFKQSIVIFDDKSTDDTVNWCKKEGFKVITWSKDNYLSDFKKYDNIIDSMEKSQGYSINASYRNSAIIKEIFEQITTQYLMINDGDIIFMNPGFMEEYESYIQKGFKVIAPFEKYNYGWNYFATYFTEKMRKKFFGKYRGMYTYNERTNKEFMSRLHFFHAIIDLEEVKAYNLYFDNLSDKEFIRLIFRNATLETGSNFCLQLEENKIPTYIIPANKVFNNWVTKENANFYRGCSEQKAKDIWVYHFRWISSFRRMADDFHRFDMNSHTWKKIKADLQNNKILTEKIMYIVNKYNTKFPRELFE